MKKFTAKRIKACAEAAAQNLLGTLRASGIEWSEAAEIAKDCGDKFAQTLELSLIEHGFNIYSEIRSLTGADGKTYLY